MTQDQREQPEAGKIIVPDPQLDCAPLLQPNIKQWCAVYVQVNHEKTVADRLEQKAIECFLPLLEKWSKRRDRRKRIQVPIFRGYLFVHEQLSQHRQVEILKVPGSVYILKGSLGPLPIPDWQIESLRSVLHAADTLQPHAFLKEGDWVRVVRGPFEGVTGILIRHKPKRGRLVVSIALIQQAVSVELNTEDVEPIKPLQVGS